MNLAAQVRDLEAKLADVHLELAAVKNEKHAGGDINDSWSLRLAIASGPVLFYMIAIRPARYALRRRRRRKRCREPDADD